MNTQPVVLRGRIRGSINQVTFLEIRRTDREAVIALRESDGWVNIHSEPLEYREIVDGLLMEFKYDRNVSQQFDKYELPYPPDRAARLLIKGAYSRPYGFRNGALGALISVLPSGPIHLFEQESGFVGRFASTDDVKIVVEAMKCRAIVFSSEKELQKLSAVDLQVVLSHLDPERKWPPKLNQKLYKEVYEMSSKANTKAAPKIAKADARQRRTDGPVAKARGIFEEMKDKGTADILEACVEAGVNRGTATTQLGRWRKENGIVVKRGGARKHDAKKDEAKKDDKKKKDGKKSATETKKGKGKSGPVKITRNAPGSKKGKKGATAPAAGSESATGGNGGGSTPAAPVADSKPTSAASPAPGSLGADLKAASQSQAG